MAEYVALLRGVNVGGATVKSTELGELFRTLGFVGVRTVLASGNVAFESADAASALKPRIEAALADRFDYDAWIVLTTREHVSSVVAEFPFDAEDPDRQPWVVFASDPAVLHELVAAADGADPVVDPLALGDGVLYWNPVKGTTLHTPFAKLLAKPRYRPTTTNRNLRTLEKLL